MHPYRRVIHMYPPNGKAFHEQRFRTSRQGAERGRKQKPAPRKTKWKREIERVGTTVYAAQTILRFQGIENYLTPEQIETEYEFERLL